MRNKTAVIISLFIFGFVFALSTSVFAETRSSLATVSSTSFAVTPDEGGSTPKDTPDDPLSICGNGICDYNERCAQSSTSLKTDEAVASVSSVGADSTIECLADCGTCPVKEDPTMSGICGDVTNDGVVDIGDAYALVNWAFSSDSYPGYEIVQPEVANVRSARNVDISAITTIVSYTMKTYPTKDMMLTCKDFIECLDFDGDGSLSDRDVAAIKHYIIYGGLPYDRQASTPVEKLNLQADWETAQQLEEYLYADGPAPSCPVVVPNHPDNPCDHPDLKNTSICAHATNDSAAVAY